MNYFPDWYNKEIIVLGCGNILFGDDGFGPAVADYLKLNFELPYSVYVENVGLRVNEILFDITLSDKKPKKIIIIDAVKRNKIPGTIFELNIDDLYIKKGTHFSFHVGPTIDFLKGLKEQYNVEIIIIGTEPKEIPEVVNPGLSPSIKDIVKETSQLIFDKYLI